MIRGLPGVSWERRTYCREVRGQHRTGRVIGGPAQPQRLDGRPHARPPPTRGLEPMSKSGPVPAGHRLRGRGKGQRLRSEAQRDVRPPWGDQPCAHSTLTTLLLWCGTHPAQGPPYSVVMETSESTVVSCEPLDPLPSPPLVLAGSIPPGLASPPHTRKASDHGHLRSWKVDVSPQ